MLLQRAEPVADPADPDIRRLIADMIETMDDANGAGLAAPQVHVPLRLFVFRVAAPRASGVPGDEPMATAVVINPEVTPLGDEIASAWEGCLSIPGLQGCGAAPGAYPLPRRSIGTASRSSARPPASTPWWCSTRWITWTGFCTRCA